LTGRPETQARDLFDLHLLRSQVVAYLEPEQGAAFTDRSVWEAMQLEVLELLHELAA